MPLILTHKILRLSVVVVFFFLLKNNVWEIKITRKTKYENNPSRSITKIKKQSNWLVQYIIYRSASMKALSSLYGHFCFIVFCNLKKSLNFFFIYSSSLSNCWVDEHYCGMNILIWRKKTTYNITNLNCSKLEAVKKFLHKKLRSGIWKIHFGTIFIK